MMESRNTEAADFASVVIASGEGGGNYMAGRIHGINASIVA